MMHRQSVLCNKLVPTCRFAFSTGVCTVSGQDLAKQEPNYDTLYNQTHKGKLQAHRATSLIWRHPREQLSKTIYICATLLNRKKETEILFYTAFVLCHISSILCIYFKT